MYLNLKLATVGALMALLLGACNLPSKTPNAAATLQAVYTLQASGVDGVQTQNPVMSATPGISTTMPTISFPTMLPATQAATQTPQAPPTQQAIHYCDWAAFAKDVTISDGTSLTPGQAFTKTWRLQNIGTCSWTSGYSLVFLNGNNLSGAASVPMPGAVGPGQFVDVSVDLIAPTSEGTYRGYWLLRNSAGVNFGLGGRGKDPFYVDIKVAAEMRTVFDFANSLCSANWSSAAGIMTCPGSNGNVKGYALKLDNPQLENGQIFSGAGLLSVPEDSKNGYLQGYYPAFTVQKGDRFKAIINCAYLSKGCDVVFRLDYQLGDGAVKTIWQYNEAYEGKYYAVDTDLSPLAGSQVKFILSVFANGSAANDKPIWAGARIERPSNLITPSPSYP